MPGDTAWSHTDCEFSSSLWAGKTTPLDKLEDEDLSVDVLVQDLFEIIKIIFPNPTDAPSLLVCRKLRLR